MKPYKILLFWSLVVVIFAVIDIIRYPFFNHGEFAVIRFLSGVGFWFFFTRGYPDSKRYFGWPLFLIFWFWWLFDSIMGIYIVGEINGFQYIGFTSNIDLAQRWLVDSFGIPLIAIWFLKLWFASVGFSVVMYKKLI